jgi:PfaD family protein
MHPSPPALVSTGAADDRTAMSFEDGAIVAAAGRFREAAHIVRERLAGESPAAGRIGILIGAFAQAEAERADWLGSLPPLWPEWLGDRSFQETHGTRFAYCTGAMANGIATVEVVSAAARAGCLGFFGAAGLMPDRVAAAIDRLQAEIPGLPFGVNLIHSPQEPHLEAAVADLLIRRGVCCVEASAFMRITPPVVRYATHGLTRDAGGNVRRKNMIVAKVSRPEVARQFLMPAPAAMLDALAREGAITREEAAIAATVPLADDVTVEADSGGHTDNQPLVAMLPVIAELARSIARAQGYARAPRIGAAGGLGTPASVAAAFALGAAYVLTGSVNQGAVESGVAPGARAMLARAGIADVAMAPAADMFEMGVEVQVLRRGTMFAARAAKLRELYLACAGLESIPGPEREKLEREVFLAPLEKVWADTEAWFRARDPEQVERAHRDPKHRMALVFRWYLGKASRWAIDGTPGRAMDYQLWCGPAMGAFNDWAKGSFLEAPEARTVGQIALNLMEGAAQLSRAGQLRSYGVPVPAAAWQYTPRPLAL